MIFQLDEDDYPAGSDDMIIVENIEFTLNGAKVAVQVDNGLSLLDALRDRLGVTSPKDGCQPMGQCGCCTVLIGGKPRLSCTMKATQAAGKSVTTLEGLPEETRKEIADCFVHAGGVHDLDRSLGTWELHHCSTPHAAMRAIAVTVAIAAGLQMRCPTTSPTTKQTIATTSQRRPASLSPPR
ncbi:MAG: 2Fe-2S iron-sulfur cluster binding domain-containing protein, partial [Acidobacteria bacterium]|nr:2Fe-2S iron-sulfur cluster binding domain-containing protein [Acidobacteriota bacterium]